MQRILSHQLPAHLGATVTVAGWVHRRRLFKSVAFLILRDTAGLAQVVVTDPATRAQVETAHRGERRRRHRHRRIRPDRRQRTARGGRRRPVELIEPVVRPLGTPAVPPPFDLFRPALTATLPTQLDHAPVALRHPTRSAALRISAAAVAGFRAALDARDFVEIHTPKIVGSATESGANVFALDYFGRPAYLAQSPQFYKQTHGRRLRTGLRGRAGLPGRAARHRRGTWRSTPPSTPNWASSPTTPT